MQIRKITVEIISILFIILWVYAGLSKLIDYDSFKYQLGKSPYLQSFSGLIAVALPLFEIIVAALLVFGRTRLMGLYLSFFTMVMFTGYIYAMLNYSHYVPCSCGGILSEMDWNTHFIFNIAFTVLGLMGILLYEHENTPNPKNDFFQTKLAQNQ